MTEPDGRGYYRDSQGRILYCPCCGASAPEGYPWETLNDGEPDPNA